MGGKQTSGNSGVSIRLDGDGACTVRHVANGAWLRTSKPREYGGTGGSFSSTDLLAAALGSCIATDVEALAVRHAVDLAGIEIDVEKTLQRRPKRIAALHVVVVLPSGVDPRLLPRFERAAAACLVRRSLAPEIPVDVAVRCAPAGGS